MFHVNGVQHPIARREKAMKKREVILPAGTGHRPKQLSWSTWRMQPEPLAQKPISYPFETQSLKNFFPWVVSQHHGWSASTSWVCSRTRPRTSTMITKLLSPLPSMGAQLVYAQTMSGRRSLRSSVYSLTTFYRGGDAGRRSGTHNKRIYIHCFHVYIDDILIGKSFIYYWYSPRCKLQCDILERSMTLS